MSSGASVDSGLWFPSAGSRVLPAKQSSVVCPLIANDDSERGKAPQGPFCLSEQVVDVVGMGEPFAVENELASALGRRFRLRDTWVVEEMSLSRVDATTEDDADTADGAQVSSTAETAELVLAPTTDEASRPARSVFCAGVSSPACARFVAARSGVGSVEL